MDRSIVFYLWHAGRYKSSRPTAPATGRMRCGPTRAVRTGDSPMNRIRFRIAGLMAIVFFIALAFAALKNASEPLASLVFMATLLLLLAATLGAILRRGPERAACLGGALFGWVYLGFFLGHWTRESYPMPHLFPALVWSYLVHF